MTYPNPSPTALKSFPGSAQPQLDKASASADARDAPVRDHEGFFSSLPRHVIGCSSQPPAWWLDERARLAAKTAVTA